MSAPSLIFIVAVTLIDVVDSTEDSNPSPPSVNSVEAKGPIVRGSPIGNMILLGLVCVGVLIYLWIQWCEKMKLHKAHHRLRPRVPPPSAPSSALPPPPVY